MITIETYEKLNEYFKAFGNKQLNLMIVVSRGGLGKTFIAEEALIEHGPLSFTGHVTPMSMYKEIFIRTREEKDFILIFDDVDTLFNNKTNVALLKQICDTREEKTIKYNTSSPMLKAVPSEFETSCKVLMLMNSLESEDKDMQALMTRAHLISFVPSDIEILRHLKTFGREKDILEFINIYAPFSKKLNLRIYRRAEELKLAGLEWKPIVISELDVDKRLFEINFLLTKYKSDTDREKNFSESRSNYYRFKKLFLAKNPILAKNIK